MIQGARTYRFKRPTDQFWQQQQKNESHIQFLCVCVCGVVEPHIQVESIKGRQISKKERKKLEVGIFGLKI